MICKACGFTNKEDATTCSHCNTPIGLDVYTPPGTNNLGTYSGDGLEPWERKRWRIAGITWAALITSCIVPPIGLILSFFAIGYAKKFRHRPGNRAAAYASLGAALHIGISFAIGAASVLMEARSHDSYDYYSQPESYGTQGDPAYEMNPDAEAELNRLLEELRKSGQ